jgi:hypothetical protein
MNDLANLIWQNCQLLDQGMNQILNLDGATFRRCDPPAYSSSTGSHFRHILEHYQMFLDGVSSELVDYDARKRDERMSTDPAFAVNVIEDLKRGLNALLPARSGMDRLRVRLAASHDPDDPSIESTSSFERELQYLQAHTIHHFAIIAMILRMNDVETEAEFGVAPSTLKHSKQIS